MRTPYVYIVTHPVLESVKVGHGAESARQPDRIESLGRYGWQIYRRLFMASPKLAYTVEQATLFQLRHRYHAPQHLPAGAIPVGGWTETASASLVPPRLAWDVLCAEAGREWLTSDQPRRRPDNRVRAVKPLAVEHVAAVRELANILGGTDALSTRNIRVAIGCSTEYAIRLRDAVRAEKKD
jgi:hypothetical protein